MEISETLVLLQPEDLASSYQLSESKDKVCQALNILWRALSEASDKQALITVNQALEMLSPVKIIRTEKVIPNNTLLEAWQIDDYDNFFDLKHVQTQEPAECLIISVLVAYQALLKFNLSSTADAQLIKKIEAQKNGFKSCVSLFKRAFNLSLERCYD